MARKSKYQKIAEQCDSGVLVADIEFGVKMNKRAKRAILASASSTANLVDEHYIKEKLASVREINKWLPDYIREARERAKN